MALMQELGYGYVLALRRSWKFAHGKALKALVTLWPRWQYTRMRIPTVNTPHRRTFRVYTKRARLRHLGDVPVVLSKRRRHDGPQQTTSLVTNLPESGPAREMVGMYLRLGWVELLCRECKGVVGLGQYQVTTQVERVERSVAVAIMAYLLLLKLRAKNIPACRPWSAFHLQRAFAWKVMQAQCERSARQLARQWLQLGKAA
jgi:hypothetical protein